LQDNKQSSNDGGSSFPQVYYFEELYRFMRESSGLAIAASYLLLILSSMMYLYFFFNEFDIDIVKYLTFEDILATPIKNPDIIFVFSAITGLIFLIDKSNTWKSKLLYSYKGKHIPVHIRLLRAVFWTPKNRRANISLTMFIVIASLAIYIVTFALGEAKDIKEQKADQVEVSLADGGEIENATLLGTTLNYLFLYETDTKRSAAYYLESIQSIKPVRSEPIKEQAVEADKIKLPEPE